MVTEGGVYVFEIWNTYAASGKNLLLIALFEVVALMYIYGHKKYRQNLVEMLGYDSWLLTWFTICWCIISPVLILFIFTFELSDYFRGRSGLKYDDYDYPWWADMIGWMFVFTAIMWIPGFAACRAIFKKFKISVSPQRSKSWILLRPRTGSMTFESKEIVTSSHAFTTSPNKDYDTRTQDGGSSRTMKN